MAHLPYINYVLLPCHRCSLRGTVVILVISGFCESAHHLVILSLKHASSDIVELNLYTKDIYLKKYQDIL